MYENAIEQSTLSFHSVWLIFTAEKRVDERAVLKRQESDKLENTTAMNFAFDVSRSFAGVLYEELRNLPNLCPKLGGLTLIQIV